jgi:hypothetical protein
MMMQFPDRTEEIKIHSRMAREAEAKGDFDVARRSYFSWVESMRQQNINTNGGFEDELDQAKKAYADFVKRDPLYLAICGEVIPYIKENPGVIQTDLYKEFAGYTREDIRYALYFAAELGRIKRVKKGRSYTLEAV